MKFVTKKLIFPFVLCIFLFAACSEVKNDNSQILNANSISANNNAKSAKDETLDLGKLITLPFTPEDIVFREDKIKPQTNSNEDNTTPVVTGKKLTAVLQFTDEDTAKIITQAEKYKNPVPAELAPESWFPPELVAASQSTGDETIKGNAYAANDFFKPPYTSGKLTRIADTNYLVLELFAN